MCTLIREGICSDNLDLIQAVVDPVLKIIFLHLFTSFFFSENILMFGNYRSVKSKLQDFVVIQNFPTPTSIPTCVAVILPFHII